MRLSTKARQALDLARRLGYKAGEEETERILADILLFAGQGEGLERPEACLACYHILWTDGQRERANRVLRHGYEMIGRRAERIQYPGARPQARSGMGSNIFKPSLMRVDKSSSGMRYCGIRTSLLRIGDLLSPIS